MKLVATLAIVWISLHGYLFEQTGTADSQRQSGMTAVNGGFVGMRRSRIMNREKSGSTKTICSSTTMKRF